MAGKDDPQHRSSGPIQVPLPGLLGLLQLKNRGGNPSQLLDSVTPAFDLTQLYLQGSMEDLDPAAHAIALATDDDGFSVFSPTPIIVPANELWWLQDYSVRSVLGAGDTLIMRAAWSPRSVGTKPVYSPGSITFANNGSGAQVSMIASMGGFFLPPGAELGVWVEGIIAATTITISANARITRLPI